jgi:phosphoribosylanthranilate isomerase
MTLLVKICGLRTPEALDVALDSGADMAGFVFFPPSPRHIGYEAARALGTRVQGRARKVALSVDATDDQFAAIIEALRPALTFRRFCSMPSSSTA